MPESTDRPTRPFPLMPQVAILTTLALIAAPIALVAGTLALAAKKRLSKRREGLAER